MKTPDIKTILTTFAILLITTTSMSAQQATVTVNQNPEIDELLNLKKDISIEAERFKIWIYSGNRAAAEAAQANFDEAYPQYPSSLEYETPNYKIYVGNFRSRLEADRAWIKIKRKFTSAFILKPEK